MGEVWGVGEVCVCVRGGGWEGGWGVGERWGWRSCCDMSQEGMEGWDKAKWCILSSASFFQADSADSTAFHSKFLL